MDLRAALAFVVTISLPWLVRGGQCGYSSCNPTVAGMLNVHLVPHTHDDVGWLKTVDQYYYGSMRKISPVGVQYIFDSVIPQLVSDPDKRFIYVEVAFLWRWWDEQTRAVKEQVRQLVDEGRLEFISGGWSMNDEASTHYNAIIDQMTVGLKWLADTFGECGRPRIAWQIDPFGHSKEQANLFALMGFDGLFFGRLDYADKSKRLGARTMEMVWDARRNGSVDHSLFTGALFNGYNPPDGLCFDEYCGDDPVMDDPRMNDYNFDVMVQRVVEEAEKQANHYATNHVMWTMGSDFKYSNANLWYKNLDKLIRAVNGLQRNESKVNLLYSTPSCYVKSLNDAGNKWTTKDDDFFPYASDPYSYWTGYFTSRPTLKGMVRRANNELQICKQMTAIFHMNSMLDSLAEMNRAMGVLQHHDAVTGTAKQAVTFDYAQRLHRGLIECNNIVAGAFMDIVDIKPRFCPLLNISQCAHTEVEQGFVVNVYNPLARHTVKYVRLPVTRGTYRVLDADLNGLTTQLVPISESVKRIPGRDSRATHHLVFMTGDLPPLGWSVYHVEKVGPSAENIKKLKIKKLEVTGGDLLKAAFDSGGMLKKIYRAGPDPFGLDVNQKFGWYQARNGSNLEPEDRASGAYIFRPVGRKPHVLGRSRQPRAAYIVRGKVVDEVHVEFNDWISQVARVYLNSLNIEFEWLVGPIPINDWVGKEIVTIYSAPGLRSAKTFYTDSNGRQMVQRIRDHRPTWNLNVTEPVSGNYYPVNSRIFLRDENVSGGNQMTVLTDRSQGGSSMADGCIELMLHRRLLCDDAFGVGEPLNEVAYDRGLVVIGRHWLQLENINAAARAHRLMAEEIFMDAQLSFSGAVSLKDFKSYAAKAKDGRSLVLLKPFPMYIHLLTLELWSDSQVLLRIEHQFDEEEDPSLSGPVRLLLSDYLSFNSHQVSAAKEVVLGANLNMDQLTRLKWRTTSSADLHGESEESRTTPVQNYWTSPVELSPMDIRTFILHLHPLA